MPRISRETGHHTPHAQDRAAWAWVLLFYLTCFALRWLEYLWLRTDQGPLGEAVWHKLAGIALLALTLGKWGPRLGLNGGWRGIGLPATGAAKDIGIGMLLGSTAFALAYAAEMTVLHWQGQTPRLAFYASSYTLQGNRAMHAGALFVLICLLGNLINVVMEEGVFRGLFMRWLLPVHGFWRAGLWSSLLFGLWHIAQPVRNVLDGTQSPASALLAAMLLVISSALLGMQYVMLLHITGTLWAGMAAHFLNNTTVNLLHVHAATGTDSLFMLRIVMAQTLSFMAVWSILRRQQRFSLQTDHETDRHTG